MSKLVPEFPRKGFLNKVKGRIIRTVRNMEREKIRAKVLSEMPVMQSPDSYDCEICLLLCRKDFDMGNIAAWSILRASTRKVRLRFFEDGSLTDEQRASLLTRFPGHGFMPRTEVDQKVRSHFGADSNIFQTRAVNPMFHKLVDIPFLANGNRVTYSDPDILYFENPQDLLDAACSSEPVAFFNRDMDSSYILPVKELDAALGREIPREVNAGLYSIPVQSLDFEIMEKYLGQKPFSDNWRYWRVEQTLFSVLPSEKGREVRWLPPGYNVDFFKDVTKVPCKHYVGYIRHGFELEGLKYLLKKIGQR